MGKLVSTTKVNVVHMVGTSKQMRSEVFEVTGWQLHAAASREVERLPDRDKQSRPRSRTGYKRHRKRNSKQEVVCTSDF